MRVRGNWISLLSWRSFSGNASQMDNSIRRLSSGLRVNTAADDAAGMAISQRIRGQYQGLVQATRNAMDGISMVQTAEAALAEVHSLLQRGYEISIQSSNDVYSKEQKQLTQIEVDNILEEIDRITDTAAFNNRKLLTSDGSAAISRVIKGLQTGWLEQAEKLVNQHYGLFGDSTNITIVLEKSGAQAAWVTGSRDGPDGGRMKDVKLHINLDEFRSPGTVGADRKVARAVTTAMLGRNSDIDLVDDWFVSGASDFIVGRDEQLKADIDAYGKQAIVDAMDDAVANTWQDDNLHQSAAYVAIKFLNAVLAPSTVKAVMVDIAGGNSLDAALSNQGLGTAQEFINLWFKPNGVAFIDTLDLSDADVGAIGGGNAADVIPDDGTWSINPMSDFEITWPTVSLLQDFTLQIGANQGDTLTFTIPELNTFTLKLLGVDVVSKAKQATELFTTAIGTVTGVRTALGSVSNRLEHAAAANRVTSENELASLSRIVDLDFAKEMTTLSRQQILVQSSGAMLAQANAARQHVMWLLRGLGPSPGGGAALGAS